MNNLQHWQLKTYDQGFYELVFSRRDKSVNSINDEVLTELDQVLEEMIANEEAQALIISSAKPAGFAVGADLDYLQSLHHDLEAVIAFVERGQAVFAKLEKLSMITVAQIHGHCLGGGMELILACDYRVALDAASTKLGLPEVMLGIQPAWGGTVRLRRVLSNQQALPLLMTGKIVSAKHAAKIGLVDAAVPERQLHNAVLYWANSKPKPSWYARFVDKQPVRKIIAAYSRRKLKQRVMEAHYPAPYQILNNFERYAASDHQAFAAEAASIRHLLTVNDTSLNLMRLFNLREKLTAFGKQTDFAAQHIHVVGAGVMGGDIAAWCVLQGFQVTLQDREPAYIAPAIQRAYQLFKKKLREPRLIQAAMDRLVPDSGGEGIAKADVIIEAITEKLSAKQALFAALEKSAKADAILASNTSSFPLDQMSQQMQNPQRLLGIHFFNPVAKMQLVEVVSMPQTDRQVQQRACAFVSQIKRLPLPVLSKPGFLINRILMPYLLESFTMLTEGIPAEAIDAAATQFGMLMGPIELADTVGLDICKAVAESLLPHYDFSVLYTPELKARLQKCIDSGKLGKKSGAGLYRYDKKKHPQKSKIKFSDYPLDDLSHRLIIRMVNEAEDCLREGIVFEGDLVDAGMVFGAGFAPFRGGPLHYAASLGTEPLQSLRKQLEMSYEERDKVGAN